MAGELRHQRGVMGALMGACHADPGLGLLGRLWRGSQTAPGGLGSGEALMAAHARLRGLGKRTEH